MCVAPKESSWVRELRRTTASDTTVAYLPHTEAARWYEMPIWRRDPVSSVATLSTGYCWLLYGMQYGARPLAPFLPLKKAVTDREKNRAFNLLRPNLFRIIENVLKKSMSCEIEDFGKLIVASCALLRTATLISFV